MLRNKTKLTVRLKYNGKFKEIKPGDGIDVRDFDIANKNVNSVEKHLMIKYPDTFTKEKSIGDPEKDKMIQDEIKDLSDRNEAIVKENEALKTAQGEMIDKYEAACGEVQAERERADSLKIEADNATGKVKDLEDEVEKLRLQIAQGSKGKK